MERTPYRTFLTWIEWLDQQWNKPSRSDHYLMQIAQEIRRVLKKHPEKIVLKHFKIPFGRTPPPPPLTPEQKLANSKAKWFGATGYKGPK